MKRVLKKIIFGMLFGALFLTPLDWLQVRYQILEYGHPMYFHLAWWPPLAYALAFLVFVFLFPYLEEVLTATFTFNHRLIFLELLVIVAAFMGPILTQNYPYLIAFIFGIYVIFRLAFLHAKWDWLFFLIGALLATTVESVLTNLNLYHFNNPDFWGIPYWLPLEWGIVALSARRVMYVIDDLAGSRRVSTPSSAKQ